MSEKKENITVLIVDPQEKPRKEIIKNELATMQELVGGYIEALYPYEDPVALICNDEGKLMGMPYNRALRDEDGHVYDVVAGTFLIAGLNEEHFDSLTDELLEKYERLFEAPEMFIKHGGGLAVLQL